MKGRIHSLESFGTVDGPGIRFVIFLQGCPLRCQYCHNPDTWALTGGEEYDVPQLLALYQKNEAFYKNGGITVTGGEPLLQTEFVTALFTEAKKKGIHTCLDTSGITFTPDNQRGLSKLDALLAVTDLLMLDIKHIDDGAHRNLTGQSNQNILAFAKYADGRGRSILIRHVVVPTLTDNPIDHYNLGYFIGSLRNIKALDVLPYHSMGESKYTQLGIPYPLAGVPQLDPQEALTARDHIMRGLRDVRKGLPPQP